MYNYIGCEKRAPKTKKYSYYILTILTLSAPPSFTIIGGSICMIQTILDNDRYTRVLLYVRERLSAYL